MTRSIGLIAAGLLAITNLQIAMAAILLGVLAIAAGVCLLMGK